MTIREMTTSSNQDLNPRFSLLSLFINNFYTYSISLYLVYYLARQISMSHALRPLTEYPRQAPIPP